MHYAKMVKQHIYAFGGAWDRQNQTYLRGDTRRRFEATSYYCDSANKFRDSDLMNEILKEDNHFSCILIIDECDPDSRSYIWNKLIQCGPRLKIVSIYNDYEETTGKISYLNPPPLNEEQIIEIIHSYDVPKDQAERYVEQCSGFPRVAHVIGENLKNNPEDLLRPPIPPMCGSHYCWGDDPENQSVQQRRLVLRHIALFKRFGFGNRLSMRLKQLLK